ncbi:MAG: major capsid protein [Verrucomicrobiota bacterium]
MASNYTNTLAGMLVLNDQNMADIYPTNVLDDAPVVKLASAIPASQGGTQHKYIRRTTAASAGFRKINTGVTNTAEVFTDVTVNCELLDASYTRDVALASAYRKGLSEYIRRETGAALRNGMFAIEKALFNFDEATQFVGLPYFNDYADTDVGQIVDAGGAGGKSVYLIRWGEDAVSIVAGNDGRIDMVWSDDSPTIVQVTDAGGTNVYSAYRVTLAGWFGLQVGSTYDVVRIANLDGTSDDLLTDDLISDALAKFPAARPPNMIVMNRTAQKELQQSRTATNPTGAPAPFPAEAFGVPIVITDALGSSEATVNGSTTTTTTSSSV